MKCHIFFIHSSFLEHLGYFQGVSIMNNAAMNLVVQVSLGDDWTSFGYMLKIDKVGSWGRLIANFHKKCEIDIESVCTSLHSHLKLRSVLQASCPLQCKLLLVLLVLAILTVVRCKLGDVLIYISMTTKDTEQYFNCIWANGDSSVEKSIFRSVPFV